MSNSKFQQFNDRSFTFCNEVRHFVQNSCKNSCCKPSSAHSAGEEDIKLCQEVQNDDDEPCSVMDSALFTINFGSSGARKGHKHSLWCPDSGATITAANQIHLFESMTEWQPKQRVRTANGQSIPVTAKGTVRLKLANDHGTETFLLEDVCFIPSFPTNLLSIKRLARDNSIKTVFGKRS